MQRRPRIAVFGEKDFPKHGVLDMPPPEAIVRRLQSLTLSSALLKTDELKDFNTFKKSLFDACVLPYGNTFPKEAFDNLRDFHYQGGCLILTGIPFTHPTTRERDIPLYWNAYGKWNDEIRVETQGAFAGRNALRLQHKGDAWIGVASQGFVVRPGGMLQLTVHVRHAEGIVVSDRDRLYLRFFDAKGQFVGQEGPKVPQKREWTQLTFRLKVPEKVATMDFSPQISGQRTVLIDEVAIIARAGGENLIKNPGFEAVQDVWTDRGHEGDWASYTEKGIGVGTFAGPLPEDRPLEVSPEDPLRLRSLNFPWQEEKRSQFLDPASVPEENTIIPILGTRLRPVAALILHKDKFFPGAVDVWAHHGPHGKRSVLGAGQLIVRGAIAALRHKGLCTSEQEGKFFQNLDKLAR